MYETFEAAFDGVHDVLRKKLAVPRELLDELQNKGVLLQSQISDIKVCVY